LNIILKLNAEDMKNRIIQRLEWLINNLAAGRWQLVTEGSLNPGLLFYLLNKN